MFSWKIIRWSSRRPWLRPKRSALHKVRKSSRTSSVSSWDCGRPRNFIGRASSRLGSPMLRTTVEPPKPVKIQNQIIFPYNLSDDDSPDQPSSTVSLDGAGAFLIFRELLVLTRARHSFGLAKDQVSYSDGMELYRVVMELCHLEFVSLRKASPLTEEHSSSRCFGMRARAPYKESWSPLKEAGSACGSTGRPLQRTNCDFHPDIVHPSPGKPSPSLRHYNDVTKWEHGCGTAHSPQ
ncbi:hypothetical protein Cgig2_028030 [Carnegiea gigantea]|uniref:Uncharacterized protein n=1 Tax=Carnegiea gigantea TaxID=171969 RepID=A0A9Q1GX14_9CARY|nr:hypothetical protein Cgig2_028030 [Carnegiea gigantea]